MAMNPEAKRKVVIALRSGEYPRGIGRLKIGSCFCFWGVVCDLHAKETGGSWSEVDRYMGLSMYPPGEVCIWAGLTMDEAVDIDGHSATPMTHSDSGRTFAKIADAIESQL